MSVPELIMRHAIEWVRETGCVPIEITLPADAYAMLLKQMPTPYDDAARGFDPGVKIYTLGGLTTISCGVSKEQRPRPKLVSRCCSYCGSDWPSEATNCRNCGAARSTV